MTTFGSAALAPTVRTGSAFHGDIDDLRLYGSALTDDQVLADMPAFQTKSTIVVGQYGSNDTDSIVDDHEAVFEFAIYARTGARRNEVLPGQGRRPGGAYSQRSRSTPAHSGLRST